jgi:hypothetical protein
VKTVLIETCNDQLFDNETNARALGDSNDRTPAVKDLNGILLKRHYSF